MQTISFIIKIIALFIIIFFNQFSSYPIILFLIPYFYIIIHNIKDNIKYFEVLDVLVIEGNPVYNNMMVSDPNNSVEGRLNLIQEYLERDVQKKENYPKKSIIPKIKRNFYHLKQFEKNNIFFGIKSRKGINNEIPLIREIDIREKINNFFRITKILLRHRESLPNYYTNLSRNTSP